MPALRNETIGIYFTQAYQLNFCRCCRGRKLITSSNGQEKISNIDSFSKWSGDLIENICSSWETQHILIYHWHVKNCWTYSTYAMRPMPAADAPCSQLLFCWRHTALDEIALCLRQVVGRSWNASNLLGVVGRASNCSQTTQNQPKVKAMFGSCNLVVTTMIRIHSNNAVRGRSWTKDDVCGVRR